MPSIFISGAAAGIGRAVAHKFLEAGWTVGAYDINNITYSAPTAGRSGELITGHLDATDYESWENALQDFTSHTGGTLDVLDNNAGILVEGMVTKISPEAIAAQIAVNCTGVTFGARAAHPYLRKTPGAHLVSMCSASAIYGQPGIMVYSASKGYVATMTEALRQEWRHDDIRVVDLLPLWAKTALADNQAASVRRLGVNITPEEVADTLWDSVHPKNAWQRGKIHYGVSRTDKVLAFAAPLAPRRLSNVINSWIAAE